MSFDPFTPFNPFNPDIPSQDSEIVVNEFMQPPFEIWIKNKLDYLFSADDEDDFNSAFDDLIAQGVGDLRFRGEKQCCRDHFRQKLWEEVKSNKGDVKTVDIVQAPSEGENKLTGTAEVTFDVAGKPYTINLQVKEDQELEAPMIPMSGRPGFIDRRRATDVTLA
ncbi:hypothetical protein QCA50_019195 [Cerrena zonata]|uniref:Uncharacterized protein n=1 Tax=Cerrena zonata TaxID=2478898 RepID=A0AAW0FJW7_9APHY